MRFLGIQTRLKVHSIQFAPTENLSYPSTWMDVSLSHGWYASVPEVKNSDHLYDVPSSVRNILERISTYKEV